jgi:hypothetical protein
MPVPILTLLMLFKKQWQVPYLYPISTSPVGPVVLETDLRPSASGLFPKQVEYGNLCSKKRILQSE